MSEAQADRLRLAFVVPRYHPSVSGGAELLTRWLAERLAARGHSVQVLTTCAIDGITWANELPPGVEQDREVTIHRFPVDERDVGLRGRIERQIRAGLDVGLDDEERWLRQGVCSRSLERHLAQAAPELDAVLGLPYLTGTTYFALAAAPRRFVVIPCLHDEVFARCEFSRRLLRDSWGIFFNSEPEQDLALRIESWPAPSAVVGLGFEPPEKMDTAAVRARYDLPERFLLYIGRLEHDKNVPSLFANFARYRARHPEGPELVVVGDGDVPVPPVGVRRLRFDWTDRDALLAAATLLIQPSVKESFSIVMMQAWLVGIPCLVDAAGAVPKFHAQSSGGGLWFDGYAEFEASLERLIEDAPLRAAMGAAGRRYVETRYAWDAVLGRFEAALAEWRATETQVAL